MPYILTEKGKEAVWRMGELDDLEAQRYAMDMPSAARKELNRRIRNHRAWLRRNCPQIYRNYYTAPHDAGEGE